MTGLKKLLMWKASGGAVSPLVEATASGNPATFTTDVIRPLVACTVTFTPVQEGTGDPSPEENVRPISGWDGVSVFVSATDTGGTEYPVTWTESGTVYGGSVDTVNGTLIKTHGSFWGTDIADIKVDSYNNDVVTGKLTIDGIPAPASNSIISNRFSTGISAGNPGRMVLVLNTHALYIVMPRADFTGTPTGNDVRQWLVDHPSLFVYPLATPETGQSSRSSIRTIIGENNVRSNANGSIELTYLKKE